MAVGNEYLIDLDASKGLAPGDLVSVVEPGEKIIHPVTKEVLGSLDRVKAVLQVTRVKGGYSYTQPVGKGEKIQRGDQVRRFAGVPAAFWDYTGRGETYFEELQQALPDLEWQGYAAAQANRPATPTAPAADAGLIFVYTDDSLTVHGAGFQVIRSYSWPKTAPTAGSIVHSPVPVPVAAPAAAALAAPAAVPVQWQSGQSAGDGGVTYPGFQKIGDLSGRTVMADFVRDGDRLLLAATDGSKIRVYAVTNGLGLLAAGDTTRPGPIYALHWWRPENGGQLYLAVTSGMEENGAYSPASGLTVSGSIYALRGDRLVPVREEISSILGSFDRDGDGQPETLLAQNFDRDIFFGDHIKEVHLAGGKVDLVDPSFAISRPFPIQGSLFADLTGSGHPQTVTVRNRTLTIYDGRKSIYESSQQMGGSISAMTYDLNPGAADRLFTTTPFEVAPVAADLDGDGRPELVAIACEGSSFRAPGIGPGISKSWIAVLKYRDGMFVKGSLGEPLENPIQGLAVTDKAILLVVSESGSLFGGEARSRLIAFPLIKEVAVSIVARPVGGPFFAEN